VRALNEFGDPAWIALDETSLVAAALARTRLTDFGLHDFREPMRIFLAALEREAKLHNVGRTLARADVAERQLEAAFDGHRAALRGRPRNHGRRRAEVDAERDADREARFVAHRELELRSLARRDDEHSVERDRNDQEAPSRGRYRGRVLPRARVVEIEKLRG
jgi:hypothetical protein